MISFILGTILGTFIGITIMCVMNIAKKEEQNDEWIPKRKDRKIIIRDGKIISKED